MLLITPTSELGRLNIDCDRILLKALTDNTATVWVTLNGKARAGYSYPLLAGDDLQIRGSLSKLDFEFEDAADKIIAVYETG